MMSTKHISNPYPNKQEKAEIMAKTGIELKQLTKWFENNRKRYWKPRVEAQLQPAMAPSRLPQETVDYLKAWMMSTKHINYPYPNEQEKAEIMAKTGIEPKQLTNWFVNNRKRYLKRREQQPTTNGASNPAPAQKTNTTQQLVSAAPSVAKPSKGPSTPPAKKMGKGKKRKGTSKYNAIKIKDSSSSSSDDESMDSDSTKDAGEAKANAAEVVHESIGMKTRSGKNRGGKVLTDAENKLLLVYPFKGADEEMLVEASTGMIELSGHRLGVKDEMDVEEVEATANDSSDQNNDEATVEVEDWVRAHYVTILQVAYNRLQPGQFLDDALLDFWMRWYDHCSCVALPHTLLSRHQLTFPPPIFHPHYRISREQSHLGNKSDVHFFTTYFMSTLEKEPSSVASWTKKIDIFKKKLIFVPVNDDNHWSLCVIVNPGLNVEGEAKAKEGSCILLLDSLKIHRTDKVAKIIRKWLNFEWKRKLGIEDSKQ
eukprot:scaffold4566_cov103-Alexandrium_tamarense.AAC.1